MIVKNKITVMKYPSTKHEDMISAGCITLHIYHPD